MNQKRIYIWLVLVYYLYCNIGHRQDTISIRGALLNVSALKLLYLISTVVVAKWVTCLQYDVIMVAKWVTCLQYDVIMVAKRVTCLQYDVIMVAKWVTCLQ